MREILFRGKRVDNGEWIKGCLLKVTLNGKTAHLIFGDNFSLDGKDVKALSHALVDPATVGQYTGLSDKNGKRIFEGDIVRYNTFDDFDCHSVVKIGEYSQDGSGGEYAGRNCLGVYVEVDNFTCPDWAENDPSYFMEYLAQQNLAEVNAECEVIGNSQDNTESLKAE